MNGGSTPTIGPIIPVKGNVVLRVADLTVRIMCVAPGPPTIAHCVTASFTVPIANAIMWSPSNVNRSKPASSAKPSTRSFPTDATIAGTPNVRCVKNGCPSMTTSVTFNPWWRKRSQNQQRRGEVAWWHHPLPCLFTPILKPCKMPRGSLSLICCVISRRRKRLSMCWRARIVPCNFCTIWTTWSMYRTVMESVRFSWRFTT